MEPTPDRQRLAGAFRFVSELASVATECAGSSAWSDELTARRRRRALTDLPAKQRDAVRREKAL
jgi:hypothetical protein